MSLVNAVLPQNRKWRGHGQAMGLGLAAIGAGFTLAEIYHRPNIVYVGLLGGVFLTAYHWNHAEYDR